MTYHPDSFKQGAPASYYCSECKYRHNKGSIRYHDHWMWRTETPEVLKVNRRKQAGAIDSYAAVGLFTLVFAIILVAGLVGINTAKKAEREEATSATTVIDPNPKPNGLTIWHDDQREVTCYMYVGTGISCLPDTKQMLWLSKNPTGLPPQTKKEN